MDHDPNPADEAILLQQCRDGDQEAFARLYALHKDRVYSTAFYFSGDHDTAQDLTQEIFVRVLHSLPSFRGDSRFGTWLYHLATNVCIDRRRKKQRSRIVPISDHEEVAGVIAHDQADDSLRERELGSAVSRALESLGEPHRQAFVLRYVAGLSYEQIAEALGCSKGTVGSRLSRGLKHLARELQQFGAAE